MARTGRPRTLADRACEQCGAAFHPPIASAKFCSRECYFESKKGRKTGPTAPRFTKVCPVCGREFVVGGKGKRQLGQVYCSRECRQTQGNLGSGWTLSAPAREMTELEAAWLAGLFDGEGTIVLAKKGRINSVRINITNTHYGLLERVAEVAGTGRIINHFPGNERHSRSWYWQCYASNARYLLRQMLPWLIVKRDKALQVLSEEKDESPGLRPPSGGAD